MRPAFDDVPIVIEVIHIIPLHEHIISRKNTPPKILSHFPRKLSAHIHENSLFVHSLRFVVGRKRGWNPKVQYTPQSGAPPLDLFVDILVIDLGDAIVQSSSTDSARISKALSIPTRP